MNKTVLEIDDYLDLYLFAKQLGDQKWQTEILAQLKNFDPAVIEHHRKLNLLWATFQTLNDKILTLYKKLKIEPNNLSYLEEILQLKKDRQTLSKQIQLQKKLAIAS